MSRRMMPRKGDETERSSNGHQTVGAYVIHRPFRVFNPCCHAPSKSLTSWIIYIYAWLGCVPQSGLSMYACWIQQRCTPIPSVAVKAVSFQQPSKSTS